MKKRTAFFLLLLLCVTFITACSQNKKVVKVVTDISEYGQFDDFKGPSTLSIFPDTILDSAQNVKYYYGSVDSILGNDYQIYLECNYSDNDYKKETERLSKITETYLNRTNSIRYDTDTFICPSYVAVLGNNQTYEYALVFNEEKKIVYVFTQFMDRDDIVIDEQYLPPNFMEGDSEHGFSIYAFKYDDVYMVNRRGSNNVFNKHIVSNGTYNFYVFTETKNDKEIIYRIVIDNMFPSDSEAFKEWTINKFMGSGLVKTEFSDLKLSPDNKTVTVTYIKDGDFKTALYNMEDYTNNSIGK